MRIGLTAVYQVVMKVIASPVLSEPGKDYGADHINLWNHSLAVATAAEIIARERGDHSEIAFTAGLLHDIGKLVINKALEGDYASVLKEAAAKQQPIHLIEKSLFNMDHADAGGILLNRWNLPQNIVLTVRYHHKPNNAGDFVRLASIVHAANYLAFTIGQGSGYESYPRFIDPKALSALRLTLDELDQHSAEVKEAFEKSRAAFN